MVYEPEPRPAYRRGYVIGERKAGGGTKYNVFLCDHGSIRWDFSQNPFLLTEMIACNCAFNESSQFYRELDSKQILPLNLEFRKSPIRYYILNIEGIVPR